MEENLEKKMEAAVADAIWKASSRPAVVAAYQEAIERGFVHDCDSNVCTGDMVFFARPVFTGSFRNAKLAGYEYIEARVISDSYGRKKQQHTFTLQRPDGERLLIKGRNLYGIFVLRQARDQKLRELALDEKYERSEEAHRRRQARRIAYDVMRSPMDQRNAPICAS